MGDELDEFLLSFKGKIGDKSYEKIAAILRENDFTSRLSLKLLDSANLEEILKGSDLPLGARKILDYHLDLIRKQSLLNRKAVRYSCNESITSPDGVCDEEPIHSIPETSEQNSIEVCTNIDMVIWIDAALRLEEVH